MISNQDRSGWFGASDTHYIMGNWDTPTFRRWWLVKLGMAQSFGGNRYTAAGNAYEHKILAHVGVTKMDRQIRIPRLRLRVNLDGEAKDTIKEVKTYKGERFIVKKAYWQQAQVEMYAAKKKLEIISYRMTEEEYKNYFLPIDGERIGHHPIEYDEGFIAAYLPRLAYLAECMKKGVLPNEGDLQGYVDRL